MAYSSVPSVGQSLCPPPCPPVPCCPPPCPPPCPPRCPPAPLCPPPCPVVCPPLPRVDSYAPSTLTSGVTASIVLTGFNLASIRSVSITSPGAAGTFVVAGTTLNANGTLSVQVFPTVAAARPGAPTSVAPGLVSLSTGTGCPSVSLAIAALFVGAPLPPA